MKLTKDHTFGIVFLSIIASILIANIGVSKSSLFGDMAVVVIPLIIGAISMLLCFLMNIAIPNSKFGFTIFLVLSNLTAGVLLRIYL